MNRIFILAIVIVVGGISMGYGEQKIKYPNVSGQFYEADPKRLSVQIDDFFAQAKVRTMDKHVDIIIAPHAGYLYSGGVAAYGFKAAQSARYKTIVILAPSHYFEFDGISVWEEGAFQTPLGAVEVDRDFSKKIIAGDGKFYFAPQAFAQEHSLEVEIPFLQKAFTDFKIVPVIMGQPSFALLEKFADTLKEIISDRRDVLIVVSTDLSHYHNDATARAMDDVTISTVKELDAKKLWQGCRSRSSMEMCGYVPVTAAVLYAQKQGLKHAQVLRYANSGDIIGDRDRVVGYASVVIYRDGPAGPLSPAPDAAVTAREVSAAPLSTAQKKRLLQIATETIHTYVSTGKVLEVKETDSRLMKDEGAFVTIHKAGRLRGCIGNIIGRQALYLTVRDVAISSATEDPRFSRVTEEELGQIEVEVSVLSKPRVITDVGEIVLGQHGVIVSQGPFHQGVFLPQVATETDWSKEEFLSQLCSQKAGLAPDAWKNPKTKIEIFSADVFSLKEITENYGGR